MSLKIKLPLFVMFVMVLNVLFIGGYYRFYLSAQISESSNEALYELQKQTDSIAAELKNRDDAAEQLEKIAHTDHLVIRVQDEAGKTLFQSGSEKGVRLEHSASSLFQFGGEVCLLRITHGVQISNVSTFQIAHELIFTEFTIIFVILLLSGGVIYLSFAKPIVSLQEKMERYRSGISPERVKRFDEIGRLQNEFVDLTETIREEKQSRDRMIASISHDIKTPLTSVMGYAERLKKSTLTPEKRTQYVDTIYRKSVVIKSLIDDFDEYLSYHVQSSLHRQLMTAEQLGRILTLDYGEELKERGAEFTMSVASPQTALSLDLAKIRRVFGNLIDNSLKHPKGDPTRISISCGNDGDVWAFSVEDNGTGVQNEEELRKIFEPFYTSDKARTFAGLGLSICREIVEAHGGQIWAENRPEGGLRVVIRLPAAK